MRKRYYTDEKYVSHAIDTVKSLDLGFDDSARIAVMDAAIGGVADSDAVVNGEYDLPNAHTIVEFVYDGTRWTVNVHENYVRETFELFPTGTGGLDVQQASSPKEIAPKIETALHNVETAYDVVSYDFTEVSAASMASAGHFCDFEFEWVVTGL